MIEKVINIKYLLPKRQRPHVGIFSHLHGYNYGESHHANVTNIIVVSQTP